ncbi:MAG TPA: hypothetical protein VJM34_04240 [Novosphingobium sp.]|nr:hypothetical protein [Novosphingobium sp.]
MHLIRTAEEMARALDSPLDAELKCLLLAHAERLEEFGGIDGLAEFLIVEAGDALADVEAAYSTRLVVDGSFAFAAELVISHAQWFEVVWIISDDGFGLVLFVQDHPETDSDIISACRQ